MDKLTQIVKDGKTLNFTYGPQHMRFTQVNANVTIYYSDKLYEEETDGTNTTWRAYIDDIAVISQTTNEGAAIRYTHRDRLGSARVFTDHNGQVEAERNYDPFGKPRLASGGLKNPAKEDDLEDTKTRRGFTDHEHLDNVELIHMNGRVYDYNLGRFMSVDPVIQSPTNSQSINPYSYIMNNPLAGTDPTGYTGCAASRIESTCESLGSSFGGYDTNYGAEAQAYGDASLANSGATAGVSRLVSNGMDRTVSTASSKMESMDIGAQKNKDNSFVTNGGVSDTSWNEFDEAWLQESLQLQSSALRNLVSGEKDSTLISGIDWGGYFRRTRDIFLAELQTIGGGTQVIAGSVIAPIGFGTGSVLGVPLIMHGTGNIQEGLGTIGNLSGIYPNTPQNFTRDIYEHVNPEYGKVAYYGTDVAINLMGAWRLPTKVAPTEGLTLFNRGAANSREVVLMYGQATTVVSANDLYGISSSLQKAVDELNKVEK